MKMVKNIFLFVVFSAGIYFMIANPIVIPISIGAGLIALVWNVLVEGN